MNAGRRGAALLVFASLCLAACTAVGWWPIAVSAPTIPPETTQAKPSPAPVTISEPAVGGRNTAPSVPAADVETLVRGNTDFALDLYRRVAGTSDGNFAFGPYSISSAVALVNAGAAGPTQRQI